jgi:tRNA (mo5U34)-methyltransferase
LSEADSQSRINSINWYHELDFPDGLKARRRETSELASHRATWKFIRLHLDRLQIEGKTVLDVGCWDGMWSFYAERRGAKSVFATDDITQNHASGEGLRLARQLFHSNIEIDQHRSVYDLASLGRKFDLIFCFGVYYHLHDPFYAFAQLRHCCHSHTTVVLEGDATLGLKANSVWLDFSNRYSSTFIPTQHALTQMLQAAHFKVSEQHWMISQRTSTGPRLRWRPVPDHLDLGMPRRTTRLLTIAGPIEAENPLHAYQPPFGLSAYDSRFSVTERSAD